MNLFVRLSFNIFLLTHSFFSISWTFSCRLCHTIHRSTGLTLLHFSASTVVTKLVNASRSVRPEWNATILFWTGWNPTDFPFFCAKKGRFFIEEIRSKMRRVKITRKLHQKFAITGSNIFYPFMIFSNNFKIFITCKIKRIPRCQNSSLRHLFSQESFVFLIGFSTFIILKRLNKR